MMKYVYSITDMCCCQLAAAVAHLLPVLNSSCLCFVAPKQGPDSGPKNGATILKLVAQLPNLTPILDHGICVLPSAKSALSCDRLHLSFMFSCAWCQDAGFPVYRYDFLCVYIYIYLYYLFIYIWKSPVHWVIGLSFFATFLSHPIWPSYGFAWPASCWKAASASLQCWSPQPPSQCPLRKRSRNHVWPRRPNSHLRVFLNGSVLCQRITTDPQIKPSFCLGFGAMPFSTIETHAQTSSISKESWIFKIQ